MLSAEQAAAELERRKREVARPRAPRVLHRTKVAGLARRIEDPRESRAVLVAQLDACSARVRRSVFDAVCPGLGGHLATLYDDGGTLTFQPHWDRRPFRAPQTPAHGRARVVDVVGRLQGLAEYRPDPVWLARWAGHLGESFWLGPQEIGRVLAQAIDDGDDEVLRILLATADGSDEVGTMGRHVVTALLCCSRPEAWDAVAALLVAAGREEGLRQSILESADEAVPGAFDRILEVVLEHDLVRFAACARAAAVWLGVWVLADDRSGLRTLLERLVALRADERARSAAVEDGPAADVFLALWAMATADVETSAAAARTVLGGADVDRRLAAARMLAALRVPCAVPGLLDALADDDLRVVAIAVDGLRDFAPDEVPASHDRIAAVLGRLATRTVELEAGPWGTPRVLAREDVAALLAWHRSALDLDRVLPWLDALRATHRGMVVDRIAASGRTPEHRATLLAGVADSSAEVRAAALRGASKLELSDDEARALEPLLRRKPSDLRRGVIELVLAKGPAWASGAAARLTASRNAQERLAGVELLRRLAATDAPEAGPARAALDGLAGDGAVGDAVASASAALAGTEQAALTLADGLGLFRPERLTPIVVPKAGRWRTDTASASELVASLSRLAAAHATTEVEVPRWLEDGTTTMPFGEVQLWRLGELARTGRGASGAGQPVAFPLASVWEAFLRDLPASSRDADGLHLLRGYLIAARRGAATTGPGDDRFGLEVARVVLEGRVLALAHADAETVDAIAEAAEQELARFTSTELRGGEDGVRRLRHPAMDLLRTVVERGSPTVDAAVAARHWRLERWLAEPPGVRPPALRGRRAGAAARVPVGGRAPWRPGLPVVAAAHRLGAATDDDVVDHLIGPRGAFEGFSDLAWASGTAPGLALTDATRRLALRARDRAVDVELRRGEAITPASEAVADLDHSGGGTVLVAALRALGRERFVRGWSSDGAGRPAVLSHVVVASRPGPEDDPSSVAAALREASIAPARIRELACYAPQWAEHAEQALGEPGFAELVWWLHAHTKDDRWTAPRGLRETWARAVARRTSLTDEALVDGAVDVAWFSRVRQIVGDEALAATMKAAKYGSTAGGHKRAELFAAAMSGTADEAELLARIEAKRHQDAVRALGLLPLPDGDGRHDAVLRRYAALGAFRHGSRRFGSQRRTTEGRATDVGIENLARTAGYRDPVRLTWAMEAHDTRDLAGDGVTATVDDLDVTLRVDEEGAPVVTVVRGEKTLKAVPAAARKHPEVKALTARRSALRGQLSRVRAALEDAMVRGDDLDGDELLALREHALLWPQLRRVVLVGDEIAGVPRDDGRTLEAHDGTVQAVGRGEPLRVAHPRDLLDRGIWPAWQRRILAARTVQPFKQVFRELYVPVGTEEERPGASRRYAGQQLQPRRAAALLTARGWALGEGAVERTDHGLGITAELTFLDGFGSPVEVEPPVVELVRFATTGDRRPVPLADVPPRLFSEVMRDVDLVVSVAHASGVDPEATMSTVELRTALLRETLAVLGVENVTFDGPRALVAGTIARYSVHLGSGTVHTLPGGAVCIVPVHAQQRGRVFLPFADDDPKTAEIVSKTLMLARDDRIKDPTILEQLRR